MTRALQFERNHPMTPMFRLSTSPPLHSALCHPLVHSHPYLHSKAPFSPSRLCGCLLELGPPLGALDHGRLQWIQ